MSTLNPLYYTDHTQLLFRHRLQWWRNILDTTIGCHFGIAAGNLYFVCVALGPEYSLLKILDLLVVLLSVATRITWRFLFIDENRFLCFRRPGKSYRRALRISTICTTLLPIILHLVIIFISIRSEDAQSLHINSGTAIAKLVLLLAASYLYFWMAHRFLVDENDENYEPTAALLSETRSTPINSPSRPEVSLHGRLATAYFMQPKAGSPLNSNTSEDWHDYEPLGTEVVAPTTSSVSAASTQPAESLPTHPLRCQTIARFDYMCQSHAGLHSWLTYPLVSWFLAAYSTLLLVMVLKFVYEDKYSKLSSPKARISLRAPLGGYLFCAFSLRYRIRKSWFSGSEITLPPPWIKIRSLFRKAIFKNSETGASADVDPCLRAFPTIAGDCARGTRSSTYFLAYNSTSDHPSTCNDYWGHLGREWIPKSRKIPTILLLGFLVFASRQFTIGFLAIFSYPLEPKKLSKLPNIAIPDIERYIRIEILKAYLMVTIAPLSLFMVFYAFFSHLSVLSFYVHDFLEVQRAKEREQNSLNES